jgi:hypothetical protein
VTKWRHTTVELAAHLPNAPLGGFDFDRAELWKVLKEYGERGWELASTIKVGGHNQTTWNPKVILIFKQPVEEEDLDVGLLDTAQDVTGEQIQSWIHSD